MKTISQATVYLQRHELFTLEDLDIALQGVSEKATAIREDMQKAANRMKAITAIQTAVADCEKHKAVHDKYIKIGWKIRKEAYVIGVHFSKESKDTLEDKMKRLMRDDVKAANF